MIPDNNIQLSDTREVSFMLRVVIVMCALLATVASFASAKSSYLSAMKSRYNIANGSKLDNCSTCHSGQWSRNVYGQDLEQAGSNNDINAAFASTDAVDSDGDGPDNETELRAGTWPGDPSDIAPAEATSWGRIKALFN